MPKIGVRGSISFYMYYGELSGGHYIPHFHAVCQGQEVSVSILSGKAFAGKMKKPHLKKVLKWGRLNQRALTKAWKLAKEGKPIPWIG